MGNTSSPLGPLSLGPDNATWLDVGSDTTLTTRA